MHLETRAKAYCCTEIPFILHAIKVFIDRQANRHETGPAML